MEQLKVIEPEKLLQALKFIEFAAKQGCLKGAYELDEAFVIKRSINTVTTAINNLINYQNHYINETQKQIEQQKIQRQKQINDS